VTAPSERLDPPTDAGRETLISACLLGVAMVVAVARNGAVQFVPFLAESSALNNATSLGVSLLIDVGFVVVVYLRAITPTRKLAALGAGLVATVVDIGTYALYVFVPTSPLSTALSWLVNSTTFLFVVAWGISRRRHALWLVGLVPALIVSVLLAWAYNSGTFWDALGEGAIWFVSAAAWYAAIGLGCLACWGFDVVGRGSSPAPPAAPQPLAPFAPAQPFGAPGYRLAAPTNSMAIAALVSALVFAPLGIVFGHIALSQLKHSGEDGKGLAIAGVVIGYVGTALFVLALVFYVVVLSALSSGLP
jgi:hypothetical protein